MTDHRSAGAEALNRGTQWIAEQQLPSGGWPGEGDPSEDAWSTAQAVLALRTADERYQPLVDRGCSWLLEHQQDDGGWMGQAYGRGRSDVSATAFSLIALQSPTSPRPEALDDSRNRAVLWLVAHGRPHGWPCTWDSGAHEDVGCTAYALRGLAYGPNTIEVTEVIQDGLYSIANATNRTATGWALGPGEDTDMTLTAYVLRAYVELEGRRGYPANRKILNRWLGWAVECQSEAGGWSDWQGIRDSPEASGYFLELVGLLGAMRMAWLEAYVTKAAALLIDTQSSNGGWKKDPSASSSTECVWVTQNAILGLRQFVEPTPLTAERSIADLRSAAVHTRFDFCVSFAGEDRAVAHALASKLEAIGASVFYDDFEQVELWGKDLVDYLAEIYSNRSTFCIPLFSKHYLRKAWPRHELRSAQVRALRTRREYILPVRIDDVTLPPAYRNVSCLSLEETPIEDVANLAFQKLRALTATSVSRSTRLARIANPATGGRIARRGKPGAEDRR